MKEWGSKTANVHYALESHQLSVAHALPQLGLRCSSPLVSTPALGLRVYRLAPSLDHTCSPSLLSELCSETMSAFACCCERSPGSLRGQRGSLFVFGTRHLGSCVLRPPGSSPHSPLPLAKMNTLLWNLLRQKPARSHRNGQECPGLQPPGPTFIIKISELARTLQEENREHLHADATVADTSACLFSPLFSFFLFLPLSTQIHI